MVRLSAAARVWLAAESQASGLNESEIVRQLIEQRMTQTSPAKEQDKMRGVAQVGHDAIVVWSPTFQTHVHDLRAQLARGCHERPHGSFQKAPTGMYFSWLDAPKGKCDLCGGRCRYR
jgi:hypothetical protein